MKKSLFLIPLIFLALTIIIILSLVNLKISPIVGEAIKESKDIQEDINNNPETTIEKENIEKEDVKNPKQESLNNLEPECEEQQIAYALKNLNKNETCTKFQNTICAEKEIICSVELHNLDEQVKGYFKINLLVLNNQGTLETIPEEYTLNPKEYTTFEETVTIKGENNLNNISCSFSTETIPKKKSC
ncbi:MAG: hypothetical protein AABX73_01555 [Nanoarchaeota archaeon]